MRSALCGAGAAQTGLLAAAIVRTRTAGIRVRGANANFRETEGKRFMAKLSISTAGPANTQHWWIAGEESAEKVVGTKIEKNLRGGQRDFPGKLRERQ